MTRHLHIDFETRSAADIKKVGAYVYAENPSTDIWCAAYSFDDGPIEVWTPGQPLPAEILDHVLTNGILYAHNANFERVIWHYILEPRYGWPEPQIEQWRCTMAMAYAMALPGSLEDAAAAVGLPVRKDMAGRRLMLQMARPRSTNPDGTHVWWDTPEKIERLIAYCRQDVEVERELVKRLRPLSTSEQELWHLDQRINDRGVYVDVPLCKAAKKIVAATAGKLDREMFGATSGAVTACSNRNQVLAFIRENGVDADSIAKDAMGEMLARDDLPEPVRVVLELRREAAKASVAKIDALLAGRSADGRARGLLQYHAASTGRWAGRRFQPQNIKRPDLEDIETAIDAVMTGDADFVESMYGRPLDVVGDCLRGMIAAGPGKRLISADYANIEGRVLAWLAGEEWKLRAFRAYDTGEGPDLYKVTAAQILGKRPEDVTKAERQGQGKVPELACGYQGSVGAFQNMAALYQFKVADEEALAIVKAWRARHPATVQLWRDMEDACVEAIRNPGAVTRAGRIAYKTAGSFLFMRLPSGRFLAYAYPAMTEKVMPWTDDDGRPVQRLCPSFMGVNSYTRKWERCFTYGGSLVENAVQAIARDILASAMPKLEAAGHPVTLTVHDEIVAEVFRDSRCLADMIEIMTDLPPWAAGCPISASGWEGERYQK